MTEVEQRVAVVETDMKHLEKKIDEMSVKLDEMHAVFLKARGAQWVIFLAASIGGFLAGKLGFFVSLFSAK